MSQVHAPYHFIPLSKWVYMPDWAHLVSHDVPFEDGISGTIEYRLTNATPLLVGGEQQKAENGKPAQIKWARDPMGNPVIPGSSLKGMLRSTLEIAGFGKMGHTDDSLFSYRDISSRSDYLERVIGNNRVEAAWLKFDSKNNQWTLRLCRYAKVKHKDIQQCYPDSKLINNDQSAVEKYEQWPLSRSVSFNVIPKSGKQKVDKAQLSLQGTQTGHLMFCNKRIVAKPKNESDYDFSYAFYTPQDEVLTEGIDAAAIACFSSHNESQVDFLQQQQQAELGIPVFGLFKKNTDEIMSIGLAQMPRVMYQHAAKDLIANHQKQAESELYFDLGELMFGTLRDRGLGLRSRVMFSDGVCVKQAPLSPSQAVTLGSPKATFLGGYIEQPVMGKYTSYDSDTAVVSGWKRYPAQTGWNKAEPEKKDNMKILSQLELMGTGSEFTGRMVFHNLKPQELGALLWSMGFGDEPDVTRLHSLGHGKALGAGAVRMTVQACQCTMNNRQAAESVESYISQFIEHMDEVYPCVDSVQYGWQTSPQVQHLLAFAEQNSNPNAQLTHMKLSEFGDAKNAKSTLPGWRYHGQELKRSDPLFSQLTGSSSYCKGRLAHLVDQIDMEADPTHQQEMSKRRLHEQHLVFKQQQLAKAKEEQLRQQQLAEMSPAEQELFELQHTLQASNESGKQECNPRIDGLLDRYLAETQTSLLAEQLIIIIKTDSLYLKISNAKKAKPRKQKVNAVIAKYNLG